MDLQKTGNDKNAAAAKTRYSLTVQTQFVNHIDWVENNSTLTIIQRFAAKSDSQMTGLKEPKHKNDRLLIYVSTLYIFLFIQATSYVDFQFGSSTPWEKRKIRRDMADENKQFVKHDPTTIV